MMTKLPRTRGRIVVVAIYAEAPKVDLFRFFWRELRLAGARVYEPEDFEAAIALAASGRLPLEKLITRGRSQGWRGSTPGGRRRIMKVWWSARGEHTRLAGWRKDGPGDGAARHQRPWRSLARPGPAL
jgi:hypothetical protein